MRYEDSMKGVADQIIKEQQRVSKIINNPEAVSYTHLVFERPFLLYLTVCCTKKILHR